ncbi:MAG: penicillin acylase family protein [Anaerolineae bacterium]|nr:penicillin acylase family protein [Anaerolineae bacterium]MDW8171683.1 penicillin acylase family protein [Anaerolineae bacterium]
MRVLRYALYGLLGLIGLLIVAAIGLYYFVIRAPLPQLDGTFAVRGLSAPVEIIRDEWGVPHIYASNSRDLFFAQGYAQAQDRWWQMEWFRHIGRGELQELTGESRAVMGNDLFIRTASWRYYAERDLAALDAETLGYLQAFADGVNAYISGRTGRELALEYSVLSLTGVNVTIRPWEPLDTLVWAKVMSWDLGGNMDAEEFLRDLGQAIGADKADAYEVDYPFGIKPTIIQPEDVAAMQTQGLLPSGGAALPSTQAISSSTAPVGLAGGFDLGTGFIFGKGQGIGSNNWVVSGDRSASGAPLLANDPHLGIQMPSIWYEVGLHCQPVSAECPFNVRGLTFATNPGVIIGHNGTIAWGVTNVGWDTQDLFQITINPQNELQYRWNDAWRDMEVREEVIRYGDSSDTTTIRVRVTHLGPIISDNQRDAEGNILGFDNERAYVLRWTSYEPSKLIRAVFGINKAQNWDEFRAALRDWDTAAQNFIYADTSGNIGYQTPGHVPVRAAGHDGRLPIRAESDEDDWRGFVPFELLPTVQNPQRGYIATANQALVPLEYYDLVRQALSEQFGSDSHYVYGYQWSVGYRGQRIVEMLEATPKHDLASFRAIHGDNKFILAEEIAPTLASLDLGEALNSWRAWMMDGWDYQMHMDSPQGALFGAFWAALSKHVLGDELGNLSVGNATGNEMWLISTIFDDPDSFWWDDIGTPERETREQIVARALQAAIDQVTVALGSDRQQWRWGALHTATFVSNPLGASGIGLIENWFNRGPVPTSGGTEIVNATSWRRDLKVRAVPSMRMIVDLADVSRSQIIHTTGQSGHNQDPRYDNMIELWRTIEYRPMLWTREQVDAAARNRMTLTPQ